MLDDLPWSLLSIIPLSKVCMTASEKSRQYGVTVSLYTLKLIQIMVSCEATSVMVCLIFPEKLHSADISLFSIPISATAVSKSHFAWKIENVKQCGRLNLELSITISFPLPETFQYSLQAASLLYLCCISDLACFWLQPIFIAMVHCWGYAQIVYAHLVPWY